MINLNDVCFLITAYQQVDLVKINIARIHSYKFPNKCPVVVVSTSEIDPGFSKLKCEFIHFFDAPANSQCTKDFVDYRDEDVPLNHRNFRGRYLPARILLSIQRGLQHIRNMGLNRVVHLHSDSYWEEGTENQIIEILESLDGKLFSGDLSDSDNYMKIPKGTHFCPESLFFNLEECYKYGYGFEYYKIWNSSFKSHNPFGTDQLIGQFAEYCLTEQNILYPNSVLSDLYKEKIVSRKLRASHGRFDGFVNIRGYQCL